MVGHPLTPWGAVTLGAAVSSTRPDVTHCVHYPTPFPVDHPLVVTLHDLTPLVVPGVMPSALRRFVYRQMNERAVRFADRIVTVSEYTAGDVTRIFPSSADKIRVTPNAVDDFADGPIGPLPSWLAGQRYLFSMGNTKAHKDLPTLLRAFASIGADHPDLLLVLAGQDPGAYAAAVLGDSPAVPRVRFTGLLDDATLRALYAGALVFAFPSTYEGFGLPPLEAMALGAPVVTTDAASIPEVVGCAALTFSPGDDGALAEALRSLLAENTARERLSAAGRARAALFSWDRTAELTVAVYTEVVRRR